MKNESNQVIYLNHDEMASALRLCYRAELLAKANGAFVRLPAIIWGAPGGGKTTLSRDLSKVICEELNDNRIEAGFWTVSLAIKDGIDLGGYGVPDHETRTMVYFPPEELPYVNTRLKKQKMPFGVFLLDDVDRGQLDALNAALSLLLDRMLNGNPISPNVYVMATANGESDAGTTSSIGAALGNRAVHLYLRPDPGWSKFIDCPTIEAVEDMLPIDHCDYKEIARCTPRSCEMAKWIMLSVQDESVLVVRAVINGCVGGEAGALISKAMNRNFSLADILNDEPIDYNAVTFDDIEMLKNELVKVKRASRVAVKQAVDNFRKKINDEFGMILEAQTAKWDNN